MAYAAQTNVSVERSRTEIERLLTRFGADSFAYGVNGNVAIVGFRASQRSIRLTLTLPGSEDTRFTHTPSGRSRTAKQAAEAHAQEVRRLYRALVLMIKARLESIESGIETFENAWLPYTLIPGGHTVAEFVGPQIDRANELGQLPAGIAGLLGPGA